MRTLIKAIETRYKGYRFRSRLEARWAVFFDALGIEWEYEKEGYQLNTGERYLPDFWLPNQNLWVEIKGEEPDFVYKRMLESFCDAMDQPLLIAIGLPSDYNTELLCWDVGDSAGGPNGWEVHIAAVQNGVLHFGLTSIGSDRMLFSDSLFENEIEVLRLRKKEILPSVWKAADKAKSARFEFGECG